MESIEKRREFVSDILDVRSALPKTGDSSIPIMWGFNGSWARSDYKEGDELDIRAYHPSWLPNSYELQIGRQEVKIYTSSIGLDERQMEEGRRSLDAKIIRVVADLEIIKDFDNELLFVRDKAKLYLQHRPLIGELHIEKKSLVRQDINNALSKLKQAPVLVTGGNVCVDKERVLNSEEIKSFRDKLPYIFCVLMNRWIPRKRNMFVELRVWHQRFGENYEELNKVGVTRNKSIKLLTESYFILDQMVKASLPR